MKVEISFGLLGDVEKCVLIEDGVEYPMSNDERKPHAARREAAPLELAPPELAPPEAAPPELAPPITDKEGELLAAMKRNGGRISAIKAATDSELRKHGLPQPAPALRFRFALVSTLRSQPVSQSAKDKKRNAESG